MLIDKKRVGWVDYAKGFCIIMVVMMHTTLGVDKYSPGHSNFMDALVAFALPFRMPDFFMISGLFVNRVIKRSWRDFLDRKVCHFGYFYALWVTIQFIVKAPDFAAQGGWVNVVEQYFLAYVQPFGSLWFIYILPIFFMVTKATRKVPPIIIFLIGCGLQMANVHTGSVLVDEFCLRYVYFFTGYWMSAHIFRFAETVMAEKRDAVFFLLSWALFEGVLVYFGYSMLPGISLFLGFIGALAVIAFSALLSTRNWAQLLRYAGQNSLVVYLAFFLPMAVLRTVFLKVAPDFDHGWMSVIILVVAVVSPLILFEITKDTRFKFLFRRPDWARLEPREAGPRSLVPAE